MNSPIPAKKEVSGQRNALKYIRDMNENFIQITQASYNPRN